MADFFRAHPLRPNQYVPNWAKDKNHLRPYLLAKGKERVREMLASFVGRHAFEWPRPDGPDGNFNVKRVYDAPLTIQAFVGIADCLDSLLTWETEEVGG